MWLVLHGKQMMSRTGTRSCGLFSAWPSSVVLSAFLEMFSVSLNAPVSTRRLASWCLPDLVVCLLHTTDTNVDSVFRGGSPTFGQIHKKDSCKSQHRHTFLNDSHWSGWSYDFRSTCYESLFVTWFSNMLGVARLKSHVQENSGLSLCWDHITHGEQHRYWGKYNSV